MKHDVVEILSRALNDPERCELARELRMEFQRVYTEFRRKVHPDYRCTPTQHRFAERAAVLCAEFDINPGEYIAYWAEHVGDFTNMRIPSLSFLSGPGNADQAACVLGPADDGKREETDLDNA